ncbi:GNAT family N-acetyltransferase [Nocardioides solisilvae]|uniref:GNAT family N-acetyltransferase n=1 Tax=Nocardioides solisilvae TaxID=1542435 RepID=UPI000D7469A8|nr:GNAT family N-acetyltransferase [Nocardioides solisilvae]
MTRDEIQVLGVLDLQEFLELTARDPVVNVFVDHRARTTRLDPRWLGGEVWGRFVDDEMVAACHVGANLVPVQCDEESATLFARRAARVGRRSSTLVGPEAAVATLWRELDGAWGRPREERWRQPHLEISGPARAEPDPEVRATTHADLDVLYPACVSMYTEEVGVSPEAGGSGDLYRARIQQLISRGWSFARFDAGRVVFKAEVACASPYAAQVQGVYVPPDLRGRGLATHGMAAVVELVRREVAPVVSLYLNDWNEGARTAYERAGFTESARFATIMF